MNFSSIIAASIMGFATLASQSEAFQVRFKPVAQQQVRAISTQPLDQVRGIELTRIVLTNGRATGYNQLTPRNGTEFRRGEPIDFYFEPASLVTRYESGHIRASMTVDIEIRNETGEIVTKQEGAWKIPLAVAASSHQPLSNIYAAMSTRPINLPVGRYQLKLRIHDDFNSTSLERVTGITVLDGQVSPV